MIRTASPAIILISGVLLAPATLAENPSANKPAVVKSDATLLSCPSSPNCVSSRSAEKHFIAPLNFSGSSTAAIKARLMAWLQQQPRTTITEAGATVITAEFRSRFMGFVDDVTLIIQPDGVVDVRSASRTGYYDFGVNRDRIETLRTEMQ